MLFGLDHDEIGHMFPNWSDEHEEILARVIKEKSIVGETADPFRNIENEIAPSIDDDEIALSDSDLAEAEHKIEEDENHKNKDGLDFNFHHGERSAEATVRHGDWAMTEWFILSSAHWLIGHSGSAFSETASAVGLSPLGAMERFDMVHGNNHARTTMRNDWEGEDICEHVSAADPAQRNCPNIKKELIIDEEQEL